MEAPKSHSKVNSKKNIMFDNESEIQQALHVDNKKTLKNVNARIKSKSTVPKQSATIQPWLLDQIIHIRHLSMHLRRTLAIVRGTKTQTR